VLGNIGACRPMQQKLSNPKKQKPGFAISKARFYQSLSIFFTPLEQRRLCFKAGKFDNSGEDI
jgi:hypothetical protein